MSDMYRNVQLAKIILVHPKCKINLCDQIGQLSNIALEKIKGKQNKKIIQRQMNKTDPKKSKDQYVK